MKNILIAFLIIFAFVGWFLLFGLKETNRELVNMKCSIKDTSTNIIPTGTYDDSVKEELIKCWNKKDCPEPKVCEKVNEQLVVCKPKECVKTDCSAVEKKWEKRLDDCGRESKQWRLQFEMNCIR